MKKKEPKPVAEEKSLTDKGLHAPAYSVSEKVRKRRRNKKIASIVLASSFAGLALMAIIAYIGRVSGNFTIQVAQKDTDARLLLSTEKDFSSASTRLLGGALENAIAASSEVTVPAAKAFHASEAGGDDHALDDTTLIAGQEVTVNRGLVYSCFLQNAGSRTLSYDVDMKMTGYVSPNNGAAEPYTYLRVGVFETIYDLSGNATHSSSKFYAAASSIDAARGESGIVYGETREFLGSSAVAFDASGRKYRYPLSGDTIPESKTLCDPFLDGMSHIFYQAYTPDGEFSHNTLAPGQIAHYTFLLYLEGSDADCKGKAPSGCSMSFALEFGPSAL
ncbi:MAG: hypothetical protein ACI4UT_04620 [Candidatus Enteromonas sp.]